MAALRETAGYKEAMKEFGAMAYFMGEDFKPEEHLEEIKSIVEETGVKSEAKREMIIQEVVTGLYEAIHYVLPERDTQ